MPHVRRRVALPTIATFTMLATLALAPGARATFPDRNGRIAFQAQTEQGIQIFTVRPNGHDLRQITRLNGDATAPDWSPDASRIAFTLNDCSVAIMDADGSDLSLIADDPSQCLSDPSFTPDGTRIVFGHFDWLGTGADEIWSMNPDGSDIQLLVPATIAGDERFGDNQDLNFPAFSPDGTRIYFNRAIPAAETIQAWVMNADGSHQHRFNVSGPACCTWEGEMAPSPDGTSVLMWRTAPDGGGNGIVLFPVDGSGDGRVIGPDVDGTAHWAWSPDSSQVLLNYNDSAEGTQVLIDPVTGDWTKGAWNDNAEPDWQRLAP